MRNQGLLIVCSFFIALILTLLPMPDWTTWLRPAWVLMVIIFWVMVAPHRVNVGSAWLAGLCVDLLSGTLLGEHALTYTIIALVVGRMHAQLRMFPMLQQALSVFLLVWLSQLILYCLQGFVGQPSANWIYWSSSVTSMLLWPWLYSLLNSSQRPLQFS